MKKAACIFLFVFLAGCGSVLNKVNESYDDGFRKSFKTSFVESCVKSAGNADVKDVCTCVADDLLKEFKVSELKDIKKIQEHAQKVSIKKCKDKIAK